MQRNCPDFYPRIKAKTLSSICNVPKDNDKYRKSISFIDGVLRQTDAIKNQKSKNNNQISSPKQPLSSPAINISQLPPDKSYRCLEDSDRTPIFGCSATLCAAVLRRKSCRIRKPLIPLSPMRKIITYGGYFEAFMKNLTIAQQQKVKYGLLLLKKQDRVSSKFVKYVGEGLFELRTEYEGTRK